jgi:hypothetical protein
MASLSGIGPNRVPDSATECKYGRWGRVSRAALDVPELAIQPMGQLVVLVIVATTGAILVAQSDDTLLARVASALVGVAVGVVLAAALLFFWRLLPGAWKRHWRIKCGRFFDGKELSSTSHTGLWLDSRHWHTVLNLRCTVTDPDGRKYESPVWTSAYYGRRVVLGPDGGSGGGFEYPNDFGAEWPRPGTYKVKWQMNGEGRARPITLARGRWRVE